ncbi:unnamed protein product [Paramecium octaurelia]|uniref:Uncharacterized protein n=1 Tax=Paramecium octaurelia TaxID=43137 RepID=A0A8S1W837_PAROT|nr:unnamed protein product [Paramecium octaurelia]
MIDASQGSRNDAIINDFDDQEANRIQNPNQSQKTNISLSEKNQERIETPSCFYRNKQVEQEKQSIKFQIDQMINHLNQMKTMCERKIEKSFQLSKPLQRNMVYLNKFTFIRIQQLITQLNSFKTQTLPNNLLELYDLLEVKMGQFYQQYQNLYFDIKMFIERSKFYLNEDNERDIKLISQIINN